MRGFTGYFATAFVAAIVASLWVAFDGGGQSLIASFQIPDGIAVRVPDLAIGFRRLLAFYHEASRPIAALIDLPAGFVVFLLLDLPGALLLSVAAHSWDESRGWATWAPLWSGLGHALMAVTVALVARALDVPSIGGLQIAMPGVALAAFVGGAVVGFLGTSDPVPETVDWRR